MFKRSGPNSHPNSLKVHFCAPEWVPRQTVRLPHLDFKTNFGIFVQTEQIMAKIAKVSLEPKNIDDCGFRFTGFSKNKFLVKKLCSPKVTAPTTKITTSERYFRTLFLGYESTLGPYSKGLQRVWGSATTSQTSSR